MLKIIVYTVGLLILGFIALVLALPDETRVTIKDKPIPPAEPQTEVIEVNCASEGEKFAVIYFDKNCDAKILKLMDHSLIPALEAALDKALKAKLMHRYHESEEIDGEMVMM